MRAHRRNADYSAIVHMKQTVLHCSWLLAIACASPAATVHPATQDVPVQTEQSGGDGELPGLLGLADRTDILVIGETHGSLEAPGVALLAIDAGLELGAPVILGLELWTSEQAGLDTYLASSGDSAARGKLLSGVFWTGTEDGRSSRAMFDLIESVRQRISEGLPAGAICFDDAVHGDPGARDELMARAILRDRAQRPDTKYVVLAGNWHTRSLKGPDVDDSRAPMTWHLRQASARVNCLKVRCSGGEFWCCTDEGCGIHRFGGEGPASGGGLQLFDQQDAQGYDGAFDLGPVNASPPAVSNAVNSTCPRSGKPIENSFLAHYRGRLVGFCNAHCRDDFAANIEERPDDRGVFDALIDTGP